MHAIHSVPPPIISKLPPPLSRLHTSIQPSTYLARKSSPLEHSSNPWNIQPDLRFRCSRWWVDKVWPTWWCALTGGFKMPGAWNPWNVCDRYGFHLVPCKKLKRGRLDISVFEKSLQLSVPKNWELKTVEFSKPTHLLPASPLAAVCQRSPFSS